MRRRRLPSRRQRKKENLLQTREATTDLRYLESVVTIKFPIRSARAYLQRNMGNPIRYKLVEVRRGEAIGIVRGVEIRHVNSGLRTFITGERVLANGEPASFYVPDHLVTIVPRVAGASADSRVLGLDDEVLLHVPVRSYLRFLPGIFQGEGPVTARQVTRTRSTALQKFGSGVAEEQAIDVEIDDDPVRPPARDVGPDGAGELEGAVEDRQHPHSPPLEGPGVDGEEGVHGGVRAGRGRRPPPARPPPRRGRPAPPPGGRRWPRRGPPPPGPPA